MFAGMIKICRRRISTHTHHVASPTLLFNHISEVVAGLIRHLQCTVLPIMPPALPPTHSKVLHQVGSIEDKIPTLDQIFCVPHANVCFSSITKAYRRRKDKQRGNRWRKGRGISGGMKKLRGKNVNVMNWNDWKGRNPLSGRSGKKETEGNVSWRLGQELNERELQEPEE